MTPMIRTAIVLCAVVCLASVHAARAEHNVAPDDFAALFNGKDLDGWWGLGTEHYDKYRKLSPEEFAKRQEQSRKNLRADHWLHNQGAVVWGSPKTQAIKQAIKRHYYPGTDDWKEMVLFRTRQIFRQTLEGLERFG